MQLINSRISALIVFIYVLNILTALILDASYNNGIFYIIDDRFADYAKVYLSLKPIFYDSTVILDSNEWMDLFRNYLLHNPYEYPFDSSFGLTIFHHPPLTFFYFIESAYLTKFGINPMALIAINVFMIAIVLFWTFFYIKKVDINVGPIGYFLIVINYPLVYAIDRGNFPSVFCSVFFILSILMYFSKEKMRGSVFFSALSICIRPNLMLAYVFIFRPSFVFKLITLAAFFSGALYFINFMILKEYTFENVYAAMRYYNLLFVAGVWGDLFNSSLFATIKFVNIVTGFDLYIVGILLFIPLFYIVFKMIAANNLVRLFGGCGFCMCITPVFGVYHLYLFVAPLLIAHSERFRASSLAKLVALGAVIIMSPKSGIVLHGFTIGSIVNPVIFMFFMCYMLYTSATE